MGLAFRGKKERDVRDWLDEVANRAELVEFPDGKVAVLRLPDLEHMLEVEHHIVSSPDLTSAPRLEIAQHMLRLYGLCLAATVVPDDSFRERTVDDWTALAFHLNLTTEDRPQVHRLVKSACTLCNVATVLTGEDVETPAAAVPDGVGTDDADAPKAPKPPPEDQVAIDAAGDQLPEVFTG